MAITITDALLILATLTGPVIAVQTQKFVERASERRRRKLHIFYSLMANRATHLAPERVQALNMIDLEFRPNRFGYQSAKAKEVTRGWKLLLDEFNGGLGENETDKSLVAAWNRRCDDLTVDLLFALSNALGFEFSKVELKRGIYYPRGHGELEASQRAILANLVKVLAGEQSLPMRITEFPVSQEALDLQAQLQKGILKALSGEGALNVSVKQQGQI